MPRSSVSAQCNQTNKIIKSVGQFGKKTKIPSHTPTVQPTIATMQNFSILSHKRVETKVENKHERGKRTSGIDFIIMCKNIASNSFRNTQPPMQPFYAIRHTTENQHTAMFDSSKFFSQATTLTSQATKDSCAQTSTSAPRSQNDFGKINHGIKFGDHNISIGVVSTQQNMFGVKEPQRKVFFGRKKNILQMNLCFWEFTRILISCHVINLLSRNTSLPYEKNESCSKENRSYFEPINFTVQNEQNIAGRSNVMYTILPFRK